MDMKTPSSNNPVSKGSTQPPRSTPCHNRLILLATTMTTLILGATMRGDWILIAVHFLKQGDNDGAANDTNSQQKEVSLLERYHMQNVHVMVLASVGVSLLSLYALGGLLMWFYYHRQRNNPEKWKCQPTKWQTPEDERLEFILGSINMCVGGTISGIIATHVLNGGYTTLYFGLLDRGPVYLVLSTIFCFLMQDYIFYYLHKIFHTPVLYRTFHKHHHRYHCPTVWSATAIHPVEFVTFELALASPMFIIPLYSGSFIICVLYLYYYGMIDHSGIMMDAVWPWQPPSSYHDDHHKYFHCNYGFTTYIWDWLHDTMHKHDHKYGEDIFHAKKNVL